MTDQPVNPQPTEAPDPNAPIVNTSRLRAFANRQKPKLKVAAYAGAAATIFVLGRKSKDVVEGVDVDVDIRTPDDRNDDQS